MRSEVCGGVRRRVHLQAYVFSDRLALACQSAEMPWLAKSLGPWDWVMRRLFLFFLVRSTMQRIGLPSVRSPAVSLPMQDNPPEDLSLRLLDSAHVGPTAGGRGLRDETWSAVGRQGERCTPCGQRSGQLIFASAITHRTIVAPPLNHKYTLKEGVWQR